MLVYSWTEEYPADLRLEIQQLTTQVKEHVKQKPVVLSNEFVGENFERNVKKLWELLGDDKVLMIGIHGMGGTGKTCIATHMEMEIRRKGNFKHVIWVTVSRDFSISKMQQDIAETIGVKLTGGDERRRAAHLSSVLSETGMKWVLILDDVWKFVDLQKVGIPLSRINGSKVILTSRLEKVFRQIDCPTDNVIRMDHLSESEGLELFLLKLGQNGTPATIHSDDKLWITKYVALKLHGLPLGITVMARTLKGIDNIERWKRTFDRLLKLELGAEMEEEVFKVLKVSYDNLMDKCKQNCFLHCALYSGGKREELIMLLVERGVINGRRSVEEIYNEGHAILDELEDHSLLWNSSGKIWMHRVNRDMACYILKLEKNNKWIVKCDKRPTEIPRWNGIMIWS
ncbi:hypothetical protein PIB30_001483 [Stylosanthes scabra]|uniref:NB-ARC domain-containing protein n=1 Tax=Stylosanthes scabra TaxID=79078 RepID=A0ABU6Q2I7_9FABA|nr:hypothetical protein [Stylosanthes scabra]